MGEVFRETLSEEEEEDFRLEGTGVPYSPQGAVRQGWGRLSTLCPVYPLENLQAGQRTGL